MQRYAIQWNADLISQAESRLKHVHQGLEQFLATLSSDSSSSGLVEPCGSFLLRTTVFTIPYAAVQQDEAVAMDITVQMPESFCSLDDVQNGAYLEKRNAFMDLVKAFFTASVEKNNDGEAEQQDEENGEKPKSQKRNAKAKQGKKSTPSAASGPFSLPSSVLVSRVAFCHDDAKHYVRLQFPTSTTMPFHVHIHARPAQVGARIASAKGAKKHSYYTNLVLEDFAMPSHLKSLHAHCVSSQNVVRSIVALKCWAAHVGLYSASFPGALTGFTVSAMVEKLLDDHVISSSMSEENMTRAVLVQIARGVFVHDDVPSLTLQGQESLNLLHRMPANVMHFIRRQAEETLQLKTLQDVFIQRNSPMELQFDVALRVSGLGAQVPSTTSDSLGRVKSSGAASSERAQYTNKILQILQKALGNRVTPTSLVGWTTTQGEAVVLCNVVSEAESRKPLTVGPAIEEAEAVKQFDLFWGAERTSTRQFPDGTIHRCVMWTGITNTSSSASDALSLSVATVVRHICFVALQKHLTSDVSVDVLLSNLEGCLFEKIGDTWADASVFTESSLRLVCGKVEELMHALPASGAPCKINSFDIISAAERGCETFAVRPHLALLRVNEAVPLAVSCSPTIEPIHCVLNIDDKHRIPDTIDAIAMMKGAIAAQLHKAIAQFAEASKDPMIRSIKTFAGTHAVDIVLRGYLFRVYIAHYREVSLLKALMKDGEAAALERKLFWTAQHSKCIRGIAQGHSSFGIATRLAKRWINAMFLSGFLLPEAIELLVAHAYLSDRAPKSSTLGFVRFLQLVADHDWRRVLVLPTVDASEVPPEIAADNHVDGMFIATPYCPAESPFTRHTPKAMIVHRLVGLARSALRTLSSLLRAGPSSAHGDAVEQLLEASLFTISDADFDVVLPIAPELCLLPDRVLSIQTADQHAAEARSVRRVWRLDELSEAESQKYIQQLAELDPAMDCVQMLRANTRDKGMLFVDGCAATKVAAVLLHPNPTPKQISELRNALVKIGKGALIAPPQSEVSEQPTTTNPSPKRTLQAKASKHQHTKREMNSESPGRRSGNSSPRTPGAKAPRDVQPSSPAVAVASPKDGSAQKRRRVEGVSH